MQRLVVGLFVVLLSSAAVHSAGAAPAELTALPVVDGDSDIGFGGGYIMSYAAVPPGYEPYRWRLESAGIATFKSADQGGLGVPYLDDYLWLHLPHVLKDKLEFRVRLSYTRETNLKFAGLGNASQLVPGLRSSDPYYEHSRERPALRWSALYHLTRAVDLSWGAAFSYNSVSVPANTRLAETMRSGSAYERALLGSAIDHAALQFSLGAAYDTRDSYVNTRRGVQLLVRADLAPGGAREMPYAYARVTSAASVFVPLMPERLVLAAHVASDLLLGDAPFYELPRYDDVYFGGAFGVRGVPGQRYWGKAKLLANLELRSELFTFSFWNKRNTFGVTGFFDSGRVWAGYASHPELDGTGLGLKLGTGAGVRLVAGSSFVLRLDVAYSPDAHPYGIYLTSGHTF
jgi:outer membrane protein assembly factor BamA